MMMANRISPGDVRDILPSSTATDAQLMPFVDAADAMVDRLVGNCLTDPVRAQITKFLAAHFWSVSAERQTSSEKLGDAQVTYMASGGEGLNGSTFGQIAKQLDCTGQLVQMGKKGITFRLVS